MKTIYDEKVYIGREEAFEIAQERGGFNLPRIGREIVTVPAISENRLKGLPDSFCQVLGKDENGYYLTTLTTEV